MPTPTLPSAPPRPPRSPSGRLLGLTLVVLLAHWAVLRAAPLTLAAHEARDAASSAVAFTTRTIAAPAPTPNTQPVAVNPARTVPARTSGKPAAARRADTTLFSPQAIEQNQPPALVEPAQAAPETIANSVAPTTTTGEAPIAVAAATTTGKPLASGSEATSTNASKTLPAKAVRSYVVPAPARLKYTVQGEVKGFPYYVNGELIWTQDGKTYDARMEISHFLLGSRVQTSTGQLTAQGLEPTRFGDKVKSEVAAHFQREKGKISFSANTPDAPLLTGAQDQLSIFMQVASMLAGDPTGFPQGSTLSFQAVGPRSADTWVFTVGATEKQALPGGELMAVHLWRDPAGEYDPKTEIWLAPDLGYLPVRIRLTQRNGDFVDQQWKATQKP